MCGCLLNYILMNVWMPVELYSDECVDICWTLFWWMCRCLLNSILMNHLTFTSYDCNVRRSLVEIQQVGDIRLHNIACSPAWLLGAQHHVWPFYRSQREALFMAWEDPEHCRSERATFWSEILKRQTASLREWCKGYIQQNFESGFPDDSPQRILHCPQVMQITFNLDLAWTSAEPWRTKSFCNANIRHILRKKQFSAS